MTNHSGPPALVYRRYSRSPSTGSDGDDVARQCAICRDYADAFDWGGTEPKDDPDDGVPLPPEG